MRLSGIQGVWIVGLGVKGDVRIEVMWELGGAVEEPQVGIA